MAHSDFPVPAGAGAGPRVFVSVGHQQMMTDAMKPLGLTLWQMVAMRPMHAAAGRLFVEISDALATPAGRAMMVGGLGQHDPLIGGALQTLIDRDFVPLRPPGDGAPPVGRPAVDPPAPIGNDPSLVAGLIAHREASLAELRSALQQRSGTNAIDFIADDVQVLKGLLLDPLSHQAAMAGMEATWWLDEHLREWLGDATASDTLTLSAPGNVTSQMGLDLMRVADVVRPHPEVVAFLRTVDDDGFVDELPRLTGGPEARAALVSFLDTYGMRCAGEIDITRPRWAEQPTALVPVLLSHVDHFAAGEAQRRFDDGARRAAAKEREVLERLRALPDGDARADETKRMIDRVRTFIGYREYPKYHIVSRMWEWRTAMLREADRLVAAGVIAGRDDAYFLTFAEFRDVVATGHVDHELVAERRDAFAVDEHRVPPRVITSDGEIVNGEYNADGIPAGALAGLGVSAGVVEGTARVVLDVFDADLRRGDILVTTHTDPSWSPLFVTAAGLVTEVGGQMTHGAVVAREYGLPAVVGVIDATRRIRDGQRIRVDGAAGTVEMLD